LAKGNERLGAAQDIAELPQWTTEEPTHRRQGRKAGEVGAGRSDGEVGWIAGVQS
jgi:hypothetical protein